MIFYMYVSMPMQLIIIQNKGKRVYDMKYEKPNMEIVVHENVYTTGRGLIENSNEGGIETWPFAKTQTGQDLPL